MVSVIVDICYQKSVYDSKQAYCNKINCCLDGGNTKLRMASSSSNCINLQTTILQTEVTSIGEDDLLNDLLKEVEVCIRNGSMPFIFYRPF